MEERFSRKVWSNLKKGEEERGGMIKLKTKGLNKIKFLKKN